MRSFGKPSLEKLRFGIFEIDLGRGELRKDGMKLRLPDQAFRILAALVQAPGEIVTREDLRQTLWSDATFVDFDNNLNGIVRRLRETLGDSAASPRFIQTVPRQGYTFIAPVQRPKTGPAAPRPLRMAMIAILAAVPLALLALWAARQASWTAPVSPERSLLAVLPFQNLTPEKIPEYFEEGLNEEIINRLARLDSHRLGIIARSSSVAYRGREKSIGEVRRELGVDLVIEGSLRMAQGRLRITARLVDASDEGHLWAETFEESPEDVLEVQTGVARRVADFLKISLLDSSQGRGHSPDSIALDACWKGKFHWNRFSGEGAAKSVGYFRQALEIDPAFAQAQAALADAYNYVGLWGVEGEEHPYQEAKEAAREALRLQPDSAAAHAALGFALLHGDWDWRQAARELGLALNLDPGRAVVHHWIAGLHSLRGMHRQAIEASRQARLLDPLSMAVNSDLAWYYYYAARFDEAIEQAERVVELQPDAPGIQGCVQLSLMGLGRDQEAIARLRESPAKAAASPRVLDELSAAGRSGSAISRNPQSARSAPRVDSLP